MIEKYTLDNLNQNSVSVKKQQAETVNNVEYLIGQPWRRGYVNSTQGRIQVQAEVPEPYTTAIMTVWGDTPTVDETAQ